MTPPFIYALVDPIEPEHIRYIGMTMCRSRRPYDHAKAARLKRFKPCHVMHWVQKLQAEGRIYDVILLEQFSKDVSVDDVRNAEIRHIKLARDAGHILTNSTSGGEGTPDPSPETRAKIGNWTEERRTNYKIQRAAKRGQVAWNKVKKGVQKAWNKGRSDYLTKEQHQQLSASAKRARKEKPFSEEARARMSVSQSGRKHPDETRQKMSESNQTVWNNRSAEDKEAYRAAIKEAWVKRRALTPSERIQRQLARAEKKLAKLKAEMANGTE